MTCLEVKHWLSEPAGRLGERGRQSIRDHSSRCGECAAYLASVLALEDKLQRLRDAPPQDSLRVRIRNIVVLGAETKQYGSRWTALKPGRTWVGIAAAALLTVTLIIRFLVPAGPSARAVAQDMAAAIQQVHNVHITMSALDYTTDNGALNHRFRSLQVVEQQWYQNHSWRKEGIYGSRLIIAYPDYPARHRDGSIGTFYRFDSQRHRVVSMGESAEQMSDFSLRGLIGPLYDSDPDVEIVGREHINGAEVTKLTLTGTGSYNGERCLCYIDDDSNLPERIDVQSLSKGYRDWTTIAEDTLEYNQNLPASTFDPSNLHDDGWSISQAVDWPPSRSPAFRTGDVYFEKASKGDWTGASAICSDPNAAGQAKNLIEPLITEFGPLNGWSSTSRGVGAALTAHNTSQVYVVTFGKHRVELDVAFMRNGQPDWKIAAIEATSR